MRTPQIRATIPDMTAMERLLARAGLTVPKLAKALGVHRVTASQWIHGGKRPRTGKLRAIADALGVTVDAVIDALDADRASRDP